MWPRNLGTDGSGRSAGTKNLTHGGCWHVSPDSATVCQPMSQGLSCLGHRTNPASEPQGSQFSMRPHRVSKTLKR